MTKISIEGIGKRFGPTAALDDVSMALASGSFTALLGPSGCGKTTLLRLIAGFEAPTEGSILFDGETVCGPGILVPPEQRRVGVVFQSYALWPHLSVGENVAYPLKARKVPRNEIASRVDDCLALVDLGRYRDRRPEELSGGQRQRVALARALVADNRIILFDEPLANLDMHLRASMIEMIRALHRRTGRTMIYVTHDQAEALALADHVAVMQAGKLRQFGSPDDVYRRPASADIAAFVGRGSVIEATVSGPSRAEVAGIGMPVRSQGPAAGPVQLLVRPEAVRIAGNGPEPSGFAATVTRCTYRGPSFEIEALLGRDAGKVVLDHRERLDPGQAVTLAMSDAWIIPGN